MDDFELATKQMSEELERHETEVMVRSLAMCLLCCNLPTTSLFPMVVIFLFLWQQDLKAALKDSENAVEELTETMTAKAKDYEEKINKCTQDIKRRDKAIAVSMFFKV